MLVQFCFDGIKSYVSSKGTRYADLFVRGITDEGTPDFEQVKLRTFDESVIQDCERLKPSDIVALDLSIKEATVDAVKKGVFI